MRLVSFALKGSSERALGSLGSGGDVLDLRRTAACLDVPQEQGARLQSMETLLADWDRGFPLAREIEARVGALPQSARRRIQHEADEVVLYPPVGHPPSVRDFMTFEEHVRNARAQRGATVPAEWYEVPVFYFSNPGSVIGDGAPLSKPAWTAALDFELELACIVARRARDVPPGSWMNVVAGLTIMNDWSARDVQRMEMAVGLGPAKGKDFATSLGPALVTLDELEPARDGDRFNLAMEARLNGRVTSRGNARAMHYGWGDLIARASQDVYLFPGDVIGSGSVGTGCLLELGPKLDSWLKPGDEVTLLIERLGALTNRIV